MSIWTAESGKGDTSGIAKALFKLCDAPTWNYDTAGTEALNPFNVICTQECEFTLYLWLKDIASNLNYLNEKSYGLPDLQSNEDLSALLYNANFKLK